MKKFVNMFCMFCAVVFLLAGCDSEASEKPHEVYDRYYKLILAGRTFEQDKAFYSKSRQAEVMAKLQASGPVLEKTLELYLKFTKQIAACGELTLLTETIDGKRATVIYSRKDTCADSSGSDGREVIEMVDEAGWKIVSNVTEFK